MMIVDRAYSAQRLWGLMLPHIAAPEPLQFARWARRFDDELLEQAIFRTSIRFALEKVQEEPSQVHRYTTGLLVNLERRAVSHQPDGAVIDRLTMQ